MSAKQLSHRASAVGQLIYFVSASNQNNRECAERCTQKNIKVPEAGNLDDITTIRRGEIITKPHNEINHRDNQNDCYRKINDEPLGFFSGLVLALEKIHVR